MKITELADLVEVIANDTDDLKVRDSDEQNFMQNIQSGRNNLKGQIFASGESEFVFNQEISLTTSVNIINNFQKVKEVSESEQIYAAILYGMDSPKGKKPDFFTDEYATAIFGYDVYELKNADSIISFTMDDDPHELISAIQVDITAAGGDDFQKNITISNLLANETELTLSQDASIKHAWSVTIPSKMYYQYIASKIQSYVDNSDVSNIKETITNNIHTAASNIASNDLTVMAYDASDIKFNASQIAKSDVALTVGDDQSSNRGATMDVDEDKEGDFTSDILTDADTKGEIEQNSTSDQESSSNSNSDIITNQEEVVIVKESEKTKTLKNILIILVAVFLVCLFFGCLYMIRNKGAQSRPSTMSSS